MSQSSPATSSVIKTPVSNTKTPLSVFRWFMDKGYAQGVFWAVMIGVVSVINDILMRFLGERLHVAEIIFFRFLFGMVTVMPLMISQGMLLFRTKHPGMHVIRAVLGVGAIGACCYAVNVMPLSENTTIMFSQPLFFLPLAVILLGEKVDAPRWLATVIGFIGLLLIVQPGTDAFHFVAFVPMIAALLFALLDIMAKKMVRTENTYSMLFYFSLGTTIAALIPAIMIWQTPTLYELFLLVLLGIGANLIQVCLIRAFSATDASGLMPFRYVELIFSALFGYLIFSEVPMYQIFLGAPLIIAGTFYITYSESRKEKNLLTENIIAEKTTQENDTGTGIK